MRMMAAKTDTDRRAGLMARVEQMKSSYRQMSEMYPHSEAKVLGHHGPICPLHPQPSLSPGCLIRFIYLIA